MLALEWDALDERYYEYGLDRGALYLNNTVIPWNGLTGFDESTESAEATILYRDGVIYMADYEATDFAGNVRALCYPDAFSEYVGIAKVSDGLYADNQKPKQFGFSYRTLVGSGNVDDLYGHQIHLVYNAVATLGSRNRSTITEEQELVEFSFDVVCKPVHLPGYRPTAHYVIDTRGMHKSRIAYIEGILYGSKHEVYNSDDIVYGPAARLPAVTELSDIVSWTSDVITEPMPENFPA